MSLSASLRRKSAVLHASGHALGIVHDHFGSTNACPLDAPEEHSFSPYLAEFDFGSALAFGMAEYESAETGSTCALPAGWNDADLSEGDRLAISMLYPPLLEHELLPRRFGIAWNGGWVFPEGSPIAFEYDWLRRGANPHWFLDPRWELQTPAYHLTLGSSGLHGDYHVTPGQAVTTTHSFSDPFGEEHFGRTTIESSNTKHAAVVSAIF